MSLRAACTTFLMLALATCVPPTIQKKICSRRVSCFNTEHCQRTVERDIPMQSDESCKGFLPLNTRLPDSGGPPCGKSEPIGVSIVACELFPEGSKPKPDIVTCSRHPAPRAVVDRRRAGCPGNAVRLHATFCCSD